MSRRGWVLFLTLSVLWGLPYFMIRIAVRQLDPATLVFARTIVASAILLPLALRQRVFGTLRGSWRWLLIYSVIEMAIPWFFMGTAERHLTSSLAGLLVASVPLVAIVLSKFAHPNEVITRRRLVGLVVGFAGVVALVGLDVHAGSMVWIGAMGIVIIGYALGPLILSLRLSHASGLAVVTASVAAVALGYAPWGVTHWPTHVRWETYEVVVGLAVFCTVAAFLVLFALIKEIGPARSVVITYFNTAVAVLLGTVGLHEPFTTGIILGFPAHHRRVLFRHELLDPRSHQRSCAPSPDQPLQ
jgi:drug/metabolite transporter (DMT)-like permease